MRIWRVEHPSDRIGPHQSQNPETRADRRCSLGIGTRALARDNDDLRPDPFYGDRVPCLFTLSEQWGCNFRDIVFGFVSPVQLANWWDDPYNSVWEELAEHRYVVSVYEISPKFVAATPYQAVFCREKALRLEDRPLGVS